MIIHSRTILTSFVGSLAIASLSSCSALKAPSVASSDFLVHGKELKEDDKHAPFLGTWTSPDAEAVLQKRTSIYVAPINLSHLRPMNRSMSSSAFTESQRQIAVKELSTYASSRLADAFDHSPAPRYKLVTKPDRNSLNLELAFVELNPNPIAGGMLRTAINAAAVPGVDSVIGKRLKANIAIEGKVRDGSSQKPVLEFADNQENKSALIISVHDFKSYGQARQAIDEWAAQVEEVLRTPLSHKVQRSAPFVILPWH